VLGLRTVQETQKHKSAKQLRQVEIIEELLTGDNSGFLES